MRCSKGTLALWVWLTLVAACDRAPLGLVTFEGEISPKLELSGTISFDATRGGFLCQKYLFQRPTQKSESVAGKFTRSGERYQLVFDTRDAPRGGFCEWKPTLISVTSKYDIDRFHSDESVALTVKPVDKTVAYAQHYPFLEPRVKSTCRFHRQRMRLDCKLADRILVDPPHELRTGLDVAYDERPAPVHD